MKNKYPYIVREVNEEEYGVKYFIEYIDFPGITGGGETLEEAIEIAKEGLEMYLDTLKSEGKLAPAPFDSSSTGRITLRMSKSVHLAASEMSNREGISLNAFINDSIIRKISYIQSLENYYKNELKADLREILEELVESENIKILKQDFKQEISNIRKIEQSNIFFKTDFQLKNKKEVSHAIAK